jgi:ribosome-binding factor A
MDPVTRARVSAHLHETLASLLAQRVRDPRVGSVTITGAQVSGDGSIARVYYSVLGNEAERRQAQQGLESVARFLRGEVGRALQLRSAPELRFEFDASLAAGERIETLLRQLHDDGAAGRADEAEPDAGPEGEERHD